MENRLRWLRVCKTLVTPQIEISLFDGVNGLAERLTADEARALADWLCILATDIELEAGDD